MVKCSVYFNRLVFVMLSWKRELVLGFSFNCGFCVVCLDLFALSLGVTGRLCFVIVSFAGCPLYYF